MLSAKPSAIFIENSIPLPSVISIKNSPTILMKSYFLLQNAVDRGIFKNSWWLFGEFPLENQIAWFQNRYIIQYSFANFKFLRWFRIWTNPRMIFFSAKVTRCWSLHTYILLSEFVFYALIISYLKCSNWRQILKLLSNFGCLFRFCYLDRVTSIKIA